MVNQGEHVYLVVRARGRPRYGFKWLIQDFSGKTYCRRRAYPDAQEVAERLSMGLPPVPERLQVLRRRPRLAMRTRVDKGLPYRLVTHNGIVVKRFKRRHQAIWWLERYNEAREAWLSRRRNVYKEDENDKTLLDAVLKRWLLADSRMPNDGRVAEIESLLRMGLA